jgi:hypothetical protein
MEGLMLRLFRWYMARKVAMGARYPGGDRRHGRLIPRTVNGRTEPYLWRAIIFRVRLLGCFLHYLVASDPDGPHCHPWDNVTIVLWGGYEEWYPDGTMRVRRAGSFVYRRAEQFHRLVPLPGGAWTLFFVGRKRRQWGFLPPNHGWYAADFGKTDDA